MRFLLTTILITLFGVTTLLSTEQSKGKDFKIIGYYHGNLADVDKYEYDKLTHIICCFTYLKGNTIGFKDTNDEKVLIRLAQKRQEYKHLKVLVAFGGWGGCETCSPVFSTDSNRRTFARSVKKLIEQYQLDGFDVDWESPVIGGFKNHPSSADDKQHFTELIKALRVELPSPLLLCFDANTFPEFVHQSIDWQTVSENVDFINLMTYGLPNDKPKHTGHHTALFSSPYQKESIHSGIQLLDSLKVPREKLIIGAGFYGFIVQNVDSVNNGLGRQGNNTKAITYSEILKQCTPENGYRELWDSVAQAPYLYSPKKRCFVTYENRLSCTLKTEFALRNTLGGIMFWKINGDVDKNGLLDTIYSTKKLFEVRNK